MSEPAGDDASHAEEAGEGAPEPPTPEPAATPATPAPPATPATPATPAALGPGAVGTGLIHAGGLLLALGVGAALGYWVSDRGVLWFPTTTGYLLILAMVALAIMIAGFYVRGRVVGHRVGRRRAVALTILLVAAGATHVGIVAMSAPVPLTTLSPDAYQLTFRSDTQHYRDLDRGLSGVLDALRRLPAFRPVQGEPRPLRADEEPLVLEAWLTFIHGSQALDRIRRLHEDYKHFDLSRLQRDPHVRSYLLTFAAELALYSHARAMIDLLDSNPNVVRFLNVARPEADLPADTVAWVREELGGLTDVARVVAGKHYLDYIDVTHGCSGEAQANGYGWLWLRVEARLEQIERRDPGKWRKVWEGLKNDFAPWKRAARNLYFPVQKEVSEWMGDTRVRRPGRYLITKPQLDALSGTLAPGDVMLGRKNWYLSNIGLPGFWPHAMLYVGTNAEIVEAFDADPEVLAWVKAESGTEQTFSAYLATTYPEAWRERAAAKREHPLVVIEAISEGVVLNTLAHAAGDYLAAMRPRLETWVKARAVARAFGWLGRPYDFDFDFATDHALVCSELVWRSYRPLLGTGDPGLRIPTVNVVGRQTLPANEYARLFRDEHGKPDRQLDFVFFLETIEKKQAAVTSDEATFLKTVDRSKWDILQR